MTMYDTEPTPDHEPSRPETDHLDVLLAMGFVHSFYEQGASDDKATTDHRFSLLSNEVSLESRFFLQFCAPKDQASPLNCDYQQMRLRPHRGSVAREQVYEIVAMFPHYQENFQPFDMPEDVTRWNDVVLDLMFADFTVGRYLLNSKGLMPYKDAESIDFETERTPDTADLFTIKPENLDPDAPRITGAQLLALLKQSVAMSQSENLDEE